LQLQKISRLVPSEETKLTRDLRSSGEGRIVEAVISRSSPMLGKTIREGKFRSRYNAAVLAVHRSGERIRSKIGDIKLKPGDTVLLLTGDAFIPTWIRSREFYMISKVSDVPTLNRTRAAISLLTLAGMVLLAATGVMPIFNAAILAAIVLIFSRCLTPLEARRAIEWNVLIVIACAFGISKALDKTGVAALFADTIVDSVKTLGPIGVLGAIYLVTSLLTEIITNNAAAALVFPIAISASTQIGSDPMPFVIAVAIAASAAFSTPFGYQTNLIVYGPGGYKFRDFLKVGIPLNIIFMVVSLLIIPMVWKF
jgi:di/tricarboxylate transporter